MYNKKNRPIKWVLCFLVISLLQLNSLWAQDKNHQWATAQSGGYTYKYVTNDPSKTRFYTLANGLSVMLSVNKKEPRIAARIAVRAGSNTDPKEHTGLAHYLEHLLFKGNQQMGTTNYAKEKPYLDKIENLYEVYKQTTDTEKRAAIYRQIDQLSGQAAKISIANEYTKVMSALGSEGTNAHTWVEETVYEEDIPSTSLNQYIKVQADRFNNPVFRIFHTELEAVYEEKNGSLDNDGNKVSEALHANIFPTSNYGQQTTIGTIEHLKSPSLKAIRAYYNKYYVPNNMAIILAGDFDADAAIKEIDKKFAYMQPKPVSSYEHAPEPEINGPVVTEVFGPSAANVIVGYRVAAEGSRDAMLAHLISSILSNGKAGLIDLNLLQQQKLLQAEAELKQYKDYGMFILSAAPQEGQTLEAAKDLLFSQIDIIKKGQFDETLLKAIVANYKRSEIAGVLNNTNRVESLMTAFIANRGEKWNDEVAYTTQLAKITKEEIVTFANQFFTDKNYTVIYKREGKDKNVAKVTKPAITPVTTNDGMESNYVKAIKAMPLTPVQPEWVDYNTAIKKSTVGPGEVLYVNNKDNELFTLTYHFDMGTWNNKLLSVATDYLYFLGTDKMSAAAINKAFYDIACDFNVSAGSDETNIVISGLQENFDKAVMLLEDLLANCKPDETALRDLKSGIFKGRSDAKLSKKSILSGLINYASYGAKNPFNTLLSNEEITHLKSAELVDILHQLTSYKHMVLYYGPASHDELTAKIKTLHKMPETFKAYPAATTFTRTRQQKNEVLFAPYDMVQSEVFWLRNTDAYDPAKELTADVFNEYFGGGMNSVVFQTIRESQALAYSTYAIYSTPSKKEDTYSFLAYVGCQADKMPQAMKSMNGLINNMPLAADRLNDAKITIKSSLESNRIDPGSLLGTYLQARRKGISYDIRKMKYDNLPKVTMASVSSFQKKEIAAKPYTYCVLGSEKAIDMNALQKAGAVKKLSLEEIFGY